MSPDVNNEDQCVPYTIPDGWKTFSASYNYILDIMPNNITTEPEGVKIWTHYYFSDVDSLDNS